MKRLEILLAGLALLAAGCSDDDDGDCKDGSCGGCTENAVSCADDYTPQVCHDGVWTPQAPCRLREMCSAGTCVEKPVCTEGETDCARGIPRVCTANRWVARPNCKTGQVCDHGSCVPNLKMACDDGAVGCFSKVLPKVCRNSAWEEADKCAAGTQCIEGRCDTPKPNYCAEGAKRCVGDTPQVCDQGLWVSARTCGADSACVDGDCVTVACNEKRFKPTCVNGKYTQCSPKTHDLVVTDCNGDGMSCVSAGNYSYCADANGTSLFTEADRDDLDAYLDDVEKRMEIPGLALGVIRNNKVVYTRTIGRTGLANGRPAVTTKTLFPIWSTSKSVTGYMIAKLVAEGVLKWTDPLKNTLAEFKSTDETATNKTDFLHAMSHSTGIMGRNDIRYSFFRMTAEETMADFLAPVAKPGELYSYNNQMYGAAGFAAVRTKYKDGTLFEAYEKAISDYVFKPLGMTSSTSNRHKLDSMGVDYTRGVHYDIDGTLREISTPDMAMDDYIDAIAPAGAIYSSLDDMMKYITAELESTDPENLKRRTGIIKETESGIGMYGLGLIIEDYNYGRAVRVYGHDGGMDGGHTTMLFAPKEKVGIMTMANNSLAGVGYLQTYFAYKVFFQAVDPGTDNSKYYTMTDEEIRECHEYDLNNDYILNPEQSLIDGIVGKYHSDDMGHDVTIVYENGNLYYDDPQLFKARINFYKGSTKYFCFTSHYSATEGLCAKVTRDSNNKVQSFIFDYADMSFVYTFKRVTGL